MIVALDGVVVTDAAAPRYQIGLRSPDQTVTLDIFRHGNRMSLQSVLGATDRTMRQQHMDSGETEQPLRLRGLSLAEEQRGVMVMGVTPGSGAARSGLMVGDRIVAVENTPVNRINQLRAIIAGTLPDNPVLIEVERQGTPFLLALP